MLGVMLYEPALFRPKYTQSDAPALMSMGLAAELAGAAAIVPEIVPPSAPGAASAIPAAAMPIIAEKFDKEKRGKENFENMVISPKKVHNLSSLLTTRLENMER